MILNITRTGSTWTRVASYKAGLEENPNCVLCGKREESDHMWACEELEKDRKEVDEDLVAINPDILHAAIKHGVAPAMSAKMQATFWGGNTEGMEKCCMRMLGHVPEGLTPISIREEARKYDGRWTAREV